MLINVRASVSLGHSQLWSNSELVVSLYVPQSRGMARSCHYKRSLVETWLTQVLVYVAARSVVCAEE